ncbi:MAG: zinc ribbon domain-containing protein [Prochlorothrix sp.]
MPLYVYHCAENQETVEVFHPMSRTIATWGELCTLASVDLGVTAPETPVKRVIMAPRLAVPTSDSDYKSLGMKKLVRRDKGVYENVTAREGESRIVDYTS